VSPAFPCTRAPAGLSTSQSESWHNWVLREDEKCVCWRALRPAVCVNRPFSL
jgi:hypothetical protein